jgi:hypothetical protein
MIQNNLNSLLCIKEEVVKKEKNEVTVQKVTLFDYLKDICYYKKGDLGDSDSELRNFDKYMILKYLSMDRGYLEIVDIINQYQERYTKKQLYDVLLFIIPKSQKYLKYPKLEKEVFKDKDINILTTYFQCSQKEVIEWLRLGLLNEVDIQDVHEKFGGKSK